MIPCWTCVRALALRDSWRVCEALYCTRSSIPCHARSVSDRPIWAFRLFLAGRHSPSQVLLVLNLATCILLIRCASLFISLLVSLVCAVPRLCACVCVRVAYYEDQSIKKQYSFFIFSFQYCVLQKLQFRFLPKSKQSVGSGAKMVTLAPFFVWYDLVNLFSKRMI